MNDSGAGSTATRKELQQALEVTTRRMGQLMRALREADLGDDLEAQLKRVRHQLNENRALLGRFSGAGETESGTEEAGGPSGGKSQAGGRTRRRRRPAASDG